MITLVVHANADAQISASPAGSVTLTVTTAESSPVSAAIVRAANTSGRTDATGRVTLRLPPGLHTIIATRIGFNPDSVTVTITANRDTSVTLTLRAHATELSDVIIVSSTRSGRRIEDEPVRVEALVREEVEEKLLMTPGDITMLLNETAGLRVQVTSPSLGGASVRIQGLRGRYTQMLADGLPLFGGQTGGFGLLQIPPMDLRGVEIIKGASSALYGGTALGGVINLLSRKPGPEPVRELLINQTYYGGTDLVSFLSTTDEKRVGYTLLGGGHHQKAVDRDRDGWIDIPGYDRVVVRPRAFWTGADGSNAMVTLGYTNEDREGGTLPGFATPDGFSGAEHLLTQSYDAGAVANISLRNGASLSFRGSGSVQRHLHSFALERHNDIRRTLFGEAAYTIQRGSSSWVLGTALQHEKYDSRHQPYFPIPDPNAPDDRFDYSHNTPGIFAQGVVDVTRWLSTAASLRYDDHSRFGAFLSPRMSVLFRPFEGWSVRASAGGGYFPLGQLVEETEAAERAYVYTFGELEAERAVSGSLDIGGTIGEVELNATVFASRVRNAAVLLPVRFDLPPPVYVDNNAQPLRTHGAELLLRMHPEPFHITGSYTFVRSTEFDPITDVRRDAPLTPRHQAGIVMMWEREGDARAGAEVYYAGVQTLVDDPYRSRSRAHTHIGILAERRFGPVRAYINAENLLDYRQTKHDPLVRPSRGPAGRWTNDVWAPLEGRVANAGLRLSF